MTNSNSQVTNSSRLDDRDSGKHKQEPKLTAISMINYDIAEEDSSKSIIDNFFVRLNAKNIIPETKYNRFATL